jgi:putative SOS response-associated peptidase YedK
MCGRYYVDDDTAREIEKLVHELDNRLNVKVEAGDVYPTKNAMVLREENERSVLCDMKWGFPQYQRKGVIFNARSESVLDKRTFSDSVKYRRCIIPGRGFYEWDGDKNKIAFERMDKQIILLAGIWNKYDTDDRFTILTTEANESMQQVHGRMPLVMEPEEVESWLYDNRSVEFLLRKKPRELNIVSGGVQQTLQL